MSWPWNRCQRSLKVTHSVDLAYGFLLVFLSNFFPKTHRFLDIWLVKYRDLENRVSGSLKVIENYTIQSGIHDFLLTFHSSHRPISHRFRDKRRFPSKIAIFSHFAYLTPPLKGFLWEFGIGARIQKGQMMGLPDGRNSFKIGLVVETQYRLWRTDGRTVALAKTALITSRG